MSHLDEGTLHALLDGELDSHEVREIQAHLGSCAACGARLQSAREMFAESDRLVGAIQFPGTPRRPAALDPGPASEADTAAQPGFTGEREYAPAEPGYEAPDTFEPLPLPRPPRPPERRLGAEPVYDEPPPVLLIPDDNQWSERRRRLLTTARWAALALVAVGAGYIASEVRRTGGVPALAPAAETRTASDESVGPVVSPEETTRPDGPVASPGAAPVEPPTTDPAAGTAAQKSAPPPPARTEPPPARAPAPAAAQENRDREQEPAPASEELQARDEALGEDVAAADIREEAAEALAELDRQRRRERAATATAALRRQAAPTEPVPAPAPAPRTLEQRAGTYLRIGLDEAARQLGRPVHVIEGMQPQFMGLAQGTASAGADPGRPVVRVVYQDNQGRMILLDQQRIRPGQTWGASATRWVIGEVGLSLQGEPGPAILQNFRPRVR
ncbi:MAG TPA: zf-HC2 domain-containing protein [Gemmatimonadales bacterium]|nr:zf-HC2 domain-containing protein [Gemmatimonadales bacterium]